MEPLSPFKRPASPATPLQQLSPDRINQQRIPASPSLPNQLSSAESKFARQSIDVQSKVAFINSINQAGSPSRQPGASSNAALQRALLGREEAESALRTSNVQLAEAEVRQRKISERVESLMEDLQALRDRQAHERQVFEKEVRKARKDSFRAGSGLVKLQEELKESRAAAKNLRADVQRERHDKEKSEQEAFERAYTLAGLLEEVETMRGKLQAVEAAREAEILEQQSIKAQQKEERRLLHETRRQEEEANASHIAKARNQPHMHATDKMVQIRQNRFERSLAAESETILGSHNSAPVEQSAQSTTNPPQALTEDDRKQNFGRVTAELRWERQLRGRAEDMVHFLQMECQFMTCACRRAEGNGKKFVHDKEYEKTTTAEPGMHGEDSHLSPVKETIAQTPISPRLDALQPEEDMFNIARPRHDRVEEEIVDKRENSPQKVFCFPASNAPSPDPGVQKQMVDESEDLLQKVVCFPISNVHSPNPSIISATSSHGDSCQFGPSSLTSIKNTSSPAICSAEDMTYQSPLRTMIRPKSVGAIPLQDPGPSVPSSPPSPSSPSAAIVPIAAANQGISPFAPARHSVLNPNYQTPQRPGLRIVRSHTTTTMMVPLRSDEDDGAHDGDVSPPQPPTPLLRTPGTPVSREAALAQIHARRDRARSVAMRSTPRGRGGDREVAEGGGGNARRGLAGGLMRDVSAPGRF